MLRSNLYSDNLFVEGHRETIAGLLVGSQKVDVLAGLIARYEICHLFQPE